MVISQRHYARADPQCPLLPLPRSYRIATVPRCATVRDGLCSVTSAVQYHRSAEQRLLVSVSRRSGIMMDMLDPECAALALALLSVLTC